jgi:diacylglycerol kinase family enzyme
MKDTSVAPTREESIFILFNPGSGKHESDLTGADLKAKFHTTGKVEVRTLLKSDDLDATVKAAIADGHDTIVAAGGDGTICGTAGALVGSGVRMGVLPLGTFNFFARSLCIPEESDEAARIVTEGRDKPITIGEVNGHVFINNASLGAYAAILNEREAIYRRWGRSRLAAYWSVLVAMVTIYRPLTMRITVDGELVRARSPMAFVAVSAYQLDEYEIEGADAIRNGKFAVLLAPDCGRFKLIWKALRFAFRGVEKGRDFTLLTGEDVLIETRRSHRLVARDGERERMEGPYRFKILKDALTVRVPRVADTDGA